MELDTSVTCLIRDDTPAKLSISCLICEESVELDEIELARLNHGLDIHSKICDKCKKAILHYRKELEEMESGNVYGKVNII